MEEVVSAAGSASERLAAESCAPWRIVRVAGDRGRGRGSVSGFRYQTMLPGASPEQLHVDVGEFTLSPLEDEMHLPAKRVSPSSLRLGEQGHEVVSKIDDRPNHLRLSPGGG